MTPEAAVLNVERRRHPRRSFDSTLVLRPEGRNGAISCSTLDLSVGGAKVMSTQPIPLGSCFLLLEAASGPLALSAEVLHVQVDAELGVVIARLRFVDAPPHAEHRLADLTGAEVAQPRNRRRLLVAGLASLAVLAVVVAVVVATRDDGQPVRTAPASSAILEHADSALRVVVTEDPKQMVALSAAPPVSADDPVQVRLAAQPQVTAGRIPLDLTIDNLGPDPLSFGSHLHATVTARRGGTHVADLVLDGDVDELAAGASTSLHGVIQVPVPGTYDFDVVVERV